MSETGTLGFTFASEWMRGQLGHPANVDGVSFYVLPQAPPGRLFPLSRLVFTSIFGSFCLRTWLDSDYFD